MDNASSKMPSYVAILRPTLGRNWCVLLGQEDGEGRIQRWQDQQVYSYGPYSYGLYVMAYVVMGYMAMAYIVMAYIVMAPDPKMARPAGI